MLVGASAGGCTACHVFAVFLNGSVRSLHVISHVSASLSAVIRGVTAVVHLRKSTAGSKQITCPRSYRLTNHKARIFLFRGILKPVGEQTRLRGIQYIPYAFLSEQISFLWILTHQSSQMWYQRPENSRGKVKTLPISPAIKIFPPQNKRYNIFFC